MNRYLQWSLGLLATGAVLAVAVAAGDSKLAPIDEPAALTCSLSDPAKVARRAELREQFLPAVTRTEELDHGYVFEFAGTDAELVMDFVSFERDCCTFFSFVVEVAPKNGPVRLTMSGPEGTKAFLDAAFGKVLSPDAKEAASEPASEKSFLDKCCDVLGICTTNGHE